MYYTQERDKWFKDIDEFTMEMKKKISDKINNVVDDCINNDYKENEIKVDNRTEPEKEKEFNEMIELKISELYGEDEVGIALTCFKLWEMKKGEKKENLE